MLLIPVTHTIYYIHHGKEVYMPYLSPKKRPFNKMRELLRAKDLNAFRLEKLLGCSQTKATRIMEKPGSINLEELFEISEKAHIPIEEIRGAIVK